MVNTGLDKKYEARESTVQDFSPIPAGKYTVKVKEIEAWKPKTQDVKRILRDDNDKALLDEKGEKVTELLKDCTFYNCNVKFEVVGGEYEGRLLFHNLTTHPNMDFSVSAFLYAIGMRELLASEIPAKCVNKTCEAVVIISTYDKKVTDKDSGIETKVPTPKNEIKYLNALPDVDTVDNELDDSGI